MKRKKPLRRSGFMRHDERIPKKARQAGITTLKQRKPNTPKRAFFNKTRQRKPPTIAEKAHMSKVARLGCCACDKEDVRTCPYTCLHHVREGYGRDQRASNWEVIPLGEPHHQGNMEPEPGVPKAIAFHRAGRTFKARYGTEIELLKEVWDRLGLDFEQLPILRGSEPPWWKAYKEGRLTTTADPEVRSLLTGPLEDII